MPKKSKKAELSDSAHRVWLAGVGALVTAGREGEKLFETLVTRGREFENGGARVRGTVKHATNRAGKAVDDTIAAALHRLGVPTRDEIAELGKKVEKLTRVVESRKVPKKRPAAKKKTAKKKVARKVKR